MFLTREFAFDQIAENDTMSKIFDAFCKRNDLDAGSVKFKWDGETVPIGPPTPRLIGPFSHDSR